MDSHSHSTLEEDVDSSSSSSCFSSGFYSGSSSSTVIPAALSSAAVTPEAETEDLMLALINAGVPDTVGLKIIIAYITIPSLRKTSPFDPSNPHQFFTSRSQFSFFGYNFSALAEADQHMIWGRPKEVKAILDNNNDPLLLTIPIDGADHRGPGFIPSGTLFERALYVGDILIEEKNSRETMAGMLKRYVIERCGPDEFHRQTNWAQQVIMEEEKAKLDIEEGDVLALNKVWERLIIADPNNLDSNVRLQAAMTEFDDQLRKPGNDQILKIIPSYCRKYYFKLGNQDYFYTPINYFFANRVYGLAQLRRLSVCDLQFFYTGLMNALSNKRDRTFELRIDVRKELGILAPDSSLLRLGSSCHLDMYIKSSGNPDPIDSGRTIVLYQHAFLEGLYQRKASHIQNIMARLDSSSNHGPALLAARNR